MTLTLADRITLLRILAVPFFIVAVLSYSSDADYWRYAALAVYGLAVLSDVADGVVARRSGQKSEVGAILDPLADKILLVSAFIGLHAVGPLLPVMSFPVWLVVAVISRDVVLVAGSVLLLVFFRELRVNVSMWGKATSCAQAACVIGLLLQWPWTKIFWPAALALTVVSGCDYIIKGLSAFNHSARKGTI